MAGLPIGKDICARCIELREGNRRERQIPKLIVSLAMAALLCSCTQVRDGGDLFLEHEVTVVDGGETRTSSSVLQLHATQTYNRPAGGAGWGGIGIRMNGRVVRVTEGANDFYFLFSRPATFTPAAVQWELVKKYFGMPNMTADESWIATWKALARSDETVDLRTEDLPAIAVVPTGGYANDARIVTYADAAALGLRVQSYRLRIVRGPVRSDSRGDFRFRTPTKDRFGRVRARADEIYPEYFEAVNATP